MTKDYTGPAWDNSDEYPSLGSQELAADLERVHRLISELEGISKEIAPFVPRATSLDAAESKKAVELAQKGAKLQQEAMILSWNASTFVNCELSVDGKNAAGKALNGKIQAIEARLEEAYNPVHQFLKLTTDEIAQKFLDSPETRAQKFALSHERKLRDQTLSLPEENLLIGVTVNGPTAFGNLYDNLSSVIRCELDLPEGKRVVGVAEAASLSQDPREEVRKAAWKGVNKGWEGHEESVASILNALAGWRLDVYKKRSYKKPVHFLDAPLHSSRISRATLEAMMSAVKEAAPLGRRAVKLQAKVLGKDKLAPWDLFAPCPARGGSTWEKPTFGDAIQQIADAYGSIHPEMGEFVHMMAKKKWIEARVGSTKRPGAYCTKFPKSRTPRVYMTYSGGMRELKTLAHELGHAFHNWVMKDMPLDETFYPMTLAETASIFGETVVGNALLEKARSPGDRLSFTWAQAREVESLILNISARFHFEKAFYERRGDTTLNPDDFKKLMVESWTEFYGDSLTEMDPMFWASKLHFSISSLSFYNYPYVFGYLFSLGVYAQRQKLKDKFYDAYVALLRDTGRMTAEEVAMKHLGADLTKPDFWRASLGESKRSVDQFEEAVAQTSSPAGGAGVRGSL